MYLIICPEDTMETMQQPTVAHSTFTLERSFPATPERVFAAFSDPKKKIRWYADGRRMEVLEFKMDFRVGGNDITRYGTPVDSPMQGAVLTSNAFYLEIKPDRRLVMAYTMALGDKPFSASLATFELIPSDTGTDLLFTEQSAFIEGGDGAELRKQGWTTLLNYLAEALAE
jgi:uncharacterized protein YndB with AHSA1/START domain